MALPANYTALEKDTGSFSTSQTKVHLYGNNDPAGPLKHSEVDANFELLRQKVNLAGAGNNALKTIYGDTVSAATSAGNASASATAAQNSATSAGSSASTASNAAATATQKATDAQGYATQAAGSASSASTSATTATTQAGIATTQANSIKNLQAETGAAGSNANYNASTGILTVPRGNTGATGATPTFSFSNGVLTITNV